MSALNRKLIRDLFGTWGTLATIVAIIAVGTGSFVGLGSAHRILSASQAAYYRDYRFGDFWIDVKRAPISAVDRLAEFPGVSAVAGRIVFDVIVDLPEEIRPISGRLLSVPEEGFDRSINGLCLVQGSGFSGRRNEEVILSESFAQAHGLRPGDRVHLILNRKRESFLIVGTAISPEYVYLVRGEGDIIPDPEHFGVFYVKDRYAREVLDFKDACNQVVGRVLLSDGNGDIELLLDRMERVLEPYGVLATTPRERQASHRFLSDEIHGLVVSATVMPTIFLVVAALVLNVVLSRLAERQRVVIGTLKAIGYTDVRVFVHFLKLGVVIGVAGGIAGGGLGIAMAAGMIEMYKEFYDFPTFLFRPHPDLLAVGMVLSVLFAVLGAAKGVWAVLRLQPAEAMHSKPPERGGAIILERIPGLWQRLGFRSQMALRTMFRNRTRTLTGVASSALSVALIFAALVMYDSAFYLIDFQFKQVAHSDVDIGMREEKSVAALLEGRELPGVDYAEPSLGVVCELRNGRRARRIGIVGLSESHRLTTPVQTDGSPIVIPPSGLVVSGKLAEVLDVKAGDTLELTPVRGRRDTRFVRVASVVGGYLGMECYGDIRYLSGIVGEAQAVNSIQLAVDPAATAAFYQAVKVLPNAQGLSVRNDTKASLEETFVHTLVVSLGIMIIFAGVIAFGTMLNTAMIEIGDRIREISTFRVLGYRPGHVSGIFLRENLATFTAGLVLAFPLGYALLIAMAQAYDSELFRMPVFIRPAAVVLTVVIAGFFVAAVQWCVHRQIRKLDWLAGIQVKE